jgi:hypothetical protein
MMDISGGKYYVYTCIENLFSTFVFNNVFVHGADFVFGNDFTLS